MNVDTEFQKYPESRWPPWIGNRCVEVKRNEHNIEVRDSKDQNGPVLNFSREEWSAFIKGVKKGHFDP